VHQDILMKKFEEDNDFVSYQVTDHSNRLKFFVRIDKNDMRAIYFKSELFYCEPLGIVDLKDEKSIIPILPGIMKATVNRVTYEVFKAVKKNIFPDKICYTSS
jgi:hypothetical protein